MQVILHLFVWFSLGAIESNLLNIIRAYPDKNVRHILAYVRGPDAGPELDAHYPNFSKLQEKIMLIPSIEIMKRGESNLVDLNDLLRLVQKVKPDVIHAPKELDFPGVYALNLLTGIPIVPVLHSGGVLLPRTFYSVYPSMFKEYPHYQVGSHAGSELFKYHQNDFPTEDLSPLISLPNCVDTTIFAPNQEKRASIRARYNIPDNAFVIGNVGALVPTKRQLWVVQTLEHILKHNPQKNVYVMFVGGGESEKHLKIYMSTLSNPEIARHVIFTGLQDETSAHYNAFDVYAHPSVTEACPLVILEALATKLPVVMYTPQARGDGTNKIYGIVQDGYNGHVVFDNTIEAFASAVEKMVIDNDYRAQFTAVARQSVEEFSPERVAQKYHEIFTAASLRPRVQQIEKFRAVFGFYYGF